MRQHISERTIARAKEPGFNEEGWAELAELLDTQKFRRMSKDRPPIAWENYPPILTNWAAKTEFWYRFKRVTEAGNLVFLELEEHTRPRGGEETVEHTMSTFEFDDNGKIIGFAVYFMVH